MEQTTAERIYAIIDAAEDDGQFGIPEDRLAAAETIAAEIDALTAERDAARAERDEAQGDIARRTAAWMATIDGLKAEIALLREKVEEEEARAESYRAIPPAWGAPVSERETKALAKYKALVARREARENSSAANRRPEG